MSILPNHTQGSTSSSCTALPLNPSSQNGKTIRPPPQSASSLSRQIGSFHFSDSRPPIPLPRNNSGPLASAAEDCGGSSQKVTGLETPNGKKTLPQEISDPHSWCHPGGRGVGFAQSTGKMSGALVSPQSQQRTGSSNSNGSTMHPSGKKAQLTNGNHLLNFYYDPISRPQHQPRAPLPRRQQKTKPYNKDLFLQANYKFVVLDSGNYAPEAMDPDKMLRWEDIICVRYSTPFLVQCPICLECPLCPQITSCGHIFCFPCILQYLLMGEEDRKGDSWKRCPLCFVMISPKDLYTIYIENVKQYRAGDTIEFMLLTRQKDSFTLSYKSKRETDFMPCLNDETCDPFSKFTFTSDVDLSVRKAISDLDSWLVKADSGLVDDLEKLPYVCAAMEQLEQRKKYWNDHRTCESGRSCKSTDYQAASHVLASAPYETCADYEACGLSHGTLSTDVNDHIKSCDDLITNKPNGGAWLDQTADESGLMEGQDTFLSSSYEDSQSLHRHSNETGDAKDKNSYNFFQAADGQHLILHPLNMRCLIHHYGSYDMLPHRISGRILQLETVTQSEAIRRRYRYLSHFSLTTTFELCEIDLSEILPPGAIYPFMDEIKKREKQRKQQAKKEQREKVKAEAAEAAAAAYSLPISTSFGQSSHDDSPTFSMDDFEALGSPPMTMSSSPPIVGERRLFSSVTRLGFAAGHDSPSLKIQEPNSLPNSGVTTNPSGANGAQNAGTPSFADIMSKAKTVETLDAAKVNEVGKKGKKPSRVLLSTSRGRRY